VTLEQLKAQLYWLLDQLAAVHEAYSSSGDEGTYHDPENNPITQGDYIWRLNSRIDSTRLAIKYRTEIAAAQTPPI
jgi:hypothetical protein